MAHDYTFDAFMDFLQYLSAHGLVKSSTAQGYRVAVSKIQDSLTEQELADVRYIEVPVVFQRYINKNRVRVAPQTLRTYQGRLETAIAEFTAWREDPTGYRPKGVTRPKQDERKRGAAAKTSSREHEASATAPKPDSSTHAAGMLTLPYPLRPDFLASIQVPRDLKVEEADRLAAFIRTLATDYKPPTTG